MILSPFPAVKAFGDLFAVRGITLSNFPHGSGFIHRKIKGSVSPPIVLLIIRILSGTLNDICSSEIGNLFVAITAPCGIVIFYIYIVIDDCLDILIFLMPAKSFPTFFPTPLPKRSIYFQKGSAGVRDVCDVIRHFLSRRLLSAFLPTPIPKRAILLQDADPIGIYRRSNIGIVLCLVGEFNLICLVYIIKFPAGVKRCNSVIPPG